MEVGISINTKRSSKKRLALFKAVFGISQKEKTLNTIATYRVAMGTTIQVSNELLEILRVRKMHEKESYEDIIWDLLEDSMELSEETKKHIAQAEQEIKGGKTVSFEEVKRRLKLKHVHH